MNHNIRAVLLSLAVLACAPALAQVGTNQPPLVAGDRIRDFMAK